MFLASCLTALFIAWIWIDYFRMIDIYERESLAYFLITFILGSLSVIIVFALDPVIALTNLSLKGTFINDFLFCFIRIGIPEEFAKMVPFIIMYAIFRRQINEPVDYFVYFAVSALGFSAVENVMYFTKHGPDLIIARSILATLGHIFNTSLIAWGFITFKYKTHRRPIYYLFIYFTAAALAHGFYDFWLLYEGVGHLGIFITILYFFFTISIFATILNNALNNSNFFSYKKVIDSRAVARKMLLYYLFVFIAQIILVSAVNNAVTAARGTIASLLTTGFIVVIAVVRLSRFKLIPGRWNKVRLELPFKIRYDALPLIKIQIKGETFNEVYVNAFYEEYFLLFPLSDKNRESETYFTGYIEKKLFLGKDEIYYLGRIFQAGDSTNFVYKLLKPKTTDITLKRNKYPIVAILDFKQTPDQLISSESVTGFTLESWACIKPFSEKK